jgi:hypothetical protein
VHPTGPTPLYLAPGEPAFAVAPAAELGGDTWLPVVEEQPGWVRVLLPARPNGATGWLHLDPTITVARSPYRIDVDRAAFRLTLTRDGVTIDTWTIGVGKPGSPTPPGRTFLLTELHDSQSTYSSIVLPLGTHSQTYTTYGGGPGTVAIHTWPTASVYGTASSDGCVRISPTALQVLSTTVPIGTPVLIK